MFGKAFAGSAHPRRFLGPLSSGARTRIWLKPVWHPCLSCPQDPLWPPSSTLKTTLGFTLTSSQSLQVFDFLILLSIHRIVSFHLFSFPKFCLTPYMISQVYVNRKSNQQNKKKKKQAKLMKTYVVFHLLKSCFPQNQLKANRGWPIIRAHPTAKLVHSTHGELYQLCSCLQSIVSQMPAMILLRACTS